MLGLIVAIVLSVLVNQDIAVEGYKPLTKVKYYFLALLSIAPYSFYFKHESNQKKITWLIWALLGTTTIASIAGMCGLFFEYNFLKHEAGGHARNYGLAGMPMNYAHNLAFFQIVLLGMIIYRDEVKKFINLNFLYIVFALNLLGLYTTYTRGAALAFLAAAPFFFFKKNKKLFVIVLLSLTILGLGAYKLAGKAVIRPLSEIERTSQWKAAIAGFSERPIFGLGYLNFEKMSTGLKTKYNIEAVYFGGHAHSNYFEALASTGIVGFIFFMGWQILWFFEMLKRDDLVAKIGLPFIVAFVVSGLTQATFTLGANLFFIMPFYALTQTNISRRQI